MLTDAYITIENSTGLEVQTDAYVTVYSIGLEARMEVIADPLQMLSSLA